MSRVPRARLLRAADPAEIARGLDEGAAHFAAGRLEAAARAYRAVERRAPDDLRAVYSLAVIDLRLGRPDPARRRLETVAARDPGQMAAWHNLGVVRQQLGDWAGAAEAYERALALRPEAAEPRQALAVALTILGRAEAAVGHYRALAEAPATRWAALTRIALVDPAAITDADLTAMRRAAEDRAVDVETRAGLWFALGEALERRGRADEAFDAFAAGNRLKRAGLPVAAAAQAHAAAAEHVRRLFTLEVLAANAGKGSRSAAPIFIVGFPRSGSTLIEQILASHPAVQGLGETGALPALVEGRYPPGPRIPAGRLRELADGYLAALAARGWDGASRVVDKTLENYLHLGLIRLLFPRAAIVHSARDAMDTGFSCFRQLFAQGAETLYDLTDIGAEYRRYREVMDHWREVLPGGVIEVSHEALIADPRAETARLLAALGLPWDEAVLRHAERDAPVRTASALQVRRPISAAAVGRWRRHAERLAPLADALGPYGPES